MVASIFWTATRIFDCLAETRLEYLIEYSQQEDVMTIQFSDKAGLLLLRAGSDDAGNAKGIIHRIRTMGGLRVAAGGKEMIEEDSDQRVEAEYDEAIEQLVVLGYIKDRGYKGEIFEFTAKGWRKYDGLSD